MKTKIRIIIVASVLVYVGLLNANAAGMFGEKNLAMISNSQNASFASEMNEAVDFRAEAQSITRWFADMAEAAVTKQVMERGFVAPMEASTAAENTEANEMINFREEARLMTREIADKEEAKVTQKVLDGGYVEFNPAQQTNSTGVTNFREEAQLEARLIADKEETKTIQKLVAEGKLAENK